LGKETVGEMVELIGAEERGRWGRRILMDIKDLPGNSSLRERRVERERRERVVAGRDSVDNMAGIGF